MEDSPTKLPSTFSNVGASERFSGLSAQTCSRNVHPNNRFAGVPRSRN
jgi:hypothetical protein